MSALRGRTFALTGLLLGRVRERVITTASLAHRESKLDLEDPNHRSRRYDPSAAYADSKLANLLFAFALQRRLTAAGSPVRSLAVHPGLARSNLLRDAVPTTHLRIGAVLQRRIGQSAEQGALPALYAATMDVPGGGHVGPNGLYQVRGKPKLVGSSKAAQDPETAAALWDLSERLTGVKYEEAGPVRP